MQSKRSQRIPRVLCQELPTPERPVAISADEAAHLQQVLRLSDGSPVLALDGKGHVIPGRYVIREKKPLIETTERTPSEVRAPEQELGSLVMEVVVMKGDAMSWVIEKAVELGARRLVPVISDHAVVQVDKKGAEHFTERWQRISDQALKQCERLNRMTVEAPRPLEELLRESLKQGTSRYVALEPKAREGWPSSVQAIGPDLFVDSAEIRILIGPEGGWSSHEIDLFRVEAGSGRIQGLDLGRLVLRAETAALFTLSCGLEARLNR